MEVFRSKPVVLDASAQMVFDFHSDPRNIVKIAQPGLKVLDVEAEVPARVGGRFRLVVAQFGLRLEWHGLWAEVCEPSLLVDTAEKCPFPGWRHEHIFDAEGSRTRMTDRVSMDLPASFWLAVPMRCALWVVFSLMFAARHAATRKYFQRCGNFCPEKSGPHASATPN